MSADSRIRGRRRLAAPALAAIALAFGLAVPAGTAAAATPAPSAASAGDRQVVGEVIDITGLRERPRGDTRLPWAEPEGFNRTPDPVPGRSLRDEVLQPVDREELRRLLEVERLLNW